MHLTHYNKTARDSLNSLIKRFGTINIEELISMFGLIIVENDKMIKKGKISCDKIFVKKGLEPDEQIFIVAHELGHRVMHFDKGKVYSFSGNSVLKKEKEANDFALLLLSLNYQVPADEIRMKLNDLYDLKI